MHSTIRKTSLSLLLSILGAVGGAGAEEDFICGTDEASIAPPAHPATSALAAPAPLAKTSALPTVRPYTGTLKAVVFRVEFADVASNVTEATVQANNVIINDFYKAMSRGKFYWEFSIWPTVLKMPGTKATYDNNFTALRNDITVAVNATGLKRGTDFAVYNVTFPQLQLGWSGLSSGGTSGQNYMNGSYGTGVTAHEMGHTVGLDHAHSINAGTADFFGTPGTESQHVEYGHPFDVMGRGGSNGHFNICYKFRDGWTDGAGVEVAEVTQSGVYRLYAHDNAEHAGRLLGIRVPAGNPAYGYWFEYRTNSTTNRKGASVMFDGFIPSGTQGGSSSRPATWFLDLTPATTTDNDGVMAPNMGFTDKYGTTTFKVVGMNAVAGAEGWVDVAVGFNGQPVGLAREPGLRRHGALDPGSAAAVAGPAFDMAGRALGRLSPARLVLRHRDGSPALTFTAP